MEIVYILKKIKTSEKIENINVESLINGVNMKLQCELKSIKQGNKSYTFLNLRKAALEWEEMLGEEMQCEILVKYYKLKK